MICGAGLEILSYCLIVFLALLEFLNKAWLVLDFSFIHHRHWIESGNQEHVLNSCTRSLMEGFELSHLLALRNLPKIKLEINTRDRKSFSVNDLSFKLRTPKFSFCVQMLWSLTSRHTKSCVTVIYRESSSDSLQKFCIVILTLSLPWAFAF